MSKVVKWGILGGSGAAEDLFLPALTRAEGNAAAAIGSRDPAKGRRLADKFSIGKVLSYRDLVEADGIDAIYVSLPNTLHEEWILKALKHGKAVLCEKPLTVTAAEAERVLEASRQAKLPVMEGLMYRFHPQNRRALQLIQGGAIGEVTEVRVHNGFRLIDFIKPDNIRLTDGLGGGALMDMGCYVVSAARMLYQKEPVEARGWLDFDKNLKTDVGFAGTLRFEENRFAQISWSFRTGYGAGYSVVGTEGTLEVPRAFIPGAVGQVPETLVIQIDTKSVRREEQLPPANHFQLMIESFSQALIKNAPPLYGPEDALSNARALDMIRDLGS